MDITNLVFKITDQMPLVLCRYLLPLINYDFLNFFFALKWTISGVPTLLQAGILDMIAREEQRQQQHM